MTSPQKTPPAARAGSRDEPTNPVPEAEGGGETSFGRFLRETRGWKRLSLAKAAGVIGCTKAHLWELEQARSRNPSISLLAGIARAYDVPIGDVAELAAALSSEAPPVVCGGEDGSSGAESGISPAAPARTEGLHSAGAIDAALGIPVPGPLTQTVIQALPLHHATSALVCHFAFALAEKLAKAEQKYGYTDGWRRDDWEDECRRQLHHHAAKGDPRDVGAYAAFCFHHGWPTTLPAEHGAPVLTAQPSDSAPATDAENPSQERAAVVPAAEQAGGDMANQLRGWARDMFTVAGIDEDDRAWLFEVAIALEGAERAAVVSAAERAGGRLTEVQPFPDDSPWFTGQASQEIAGYRLVLTCNACPEQYDVFWGDEQVGYLRLRHGSFTAEAPDCGGKLVYEAEPIGDGLFEEGERPHHLAAAVAAINAWRFPPPDHDAIPSAEGGPGKDTRDEENGLREKIALVLDEVAVTATQGNPRRHIEQRRRWAYSRADQILALLQSPRGEA